MCNTFRVSKSGYYDWLNRRGTGFYLFSILDNGKVLKNIIVFLVLGILLGEFIARLFVITSNMPNRIIDGIGIQKYLPEQHGIWKGRKHT